MSKKQILVKAIVAHLKTVGVESKTVENWQDGQDAIFPSFGMNDMQDAGIDTFSFPEVKGAWSDWYSEGVIVVGNE
jgi:hypothetical protein